MISRRVVTTFMVAAMASLLSAGPAPAAQFGFKPGAEGFSSLSIGEGGAPEVRAGSHPVALITTLNFEPGPESPGQPGVPFTTGDVRDLSLELPPGLVENPSAVPQCTQAEFHTPRTSPFEASLSGESCPASSQIGIVEVRSSYGGGSVRTFGVFNLAPPPGAPSELGFNPYGAPIVFVPHVRQAEGEYGLTLEAHGIPQLIDISGITLTIWGSPWSILHNYQRGNCLNEVEPTYGWAKCSVGPPAQNPATAYITLPTACEGPLSFTATATSWDQPEVRSSRTYASQSLQGCDVLPFTPSSLALVSNPRASSPSGFDFDLDSENLGLLKPGGVASSPVRKAVVALPEGMTINPSVGAGLGSCTPAQYAAETVTSAPGAGCPNDSKIGDFTVQSSLFPETVEGSLFLASPYENPSGTLIAVYLVAKRSERGILVKVAGRIDPDPAGGTLIATFEGLPQLPYSNLRIHFREGQRSPLATPPACGSFSTSVDLTPWRSPVVHHSASTLTISAGVGGGPCPSASTPFAPVARSGTLNSKAGAYSPFYLHLTRGDDEQEITSYSTILPPGLTGRLAGIPYCPDAAIEAAKHESGFAEIANPSCPAASEIGHTIAGYGLGPVLAFAPGGLFLAGPFHGAPFSVVAIDSATVGPFDLGTVVIRSAIHVDPRTAQVSIDSAGSDPIPHIIKGIPIHLRDVRVYIDRPNFTLNPSSCEAFGVGSVLGGSGQRYSDPSDDVVASAANPFQAFDCGSLGFEPKLTLRLHGGTKRGQFPSLRAEVLPRAGDANIGAATVALPPSEFLEQNHIETICSRAQFAREACPAGSVYGKARAFSPLLGEPLEGNVYLRASDEQLPDLVASLRGGGNDLSIEVVGHIDSFRGGLRGRFESLPDAPVSRFVMNLRGGKHGLLVNSENLCTTKNLGTAKFIGQNRLGEKWRPPLKVKCKHSGGRKQRGKRGHR